MIGVLSYGSTDDYETFLKRETESVSNSDKKHHINELKTLFMFVHRTGHAVARVGNRQQKVKNNRYSILQKNSKE